MGYIVGRATIVDRLFISLNDATRNVPGSMAIAALANLRLIICLLMAAYDLLVFSFRNKNGRAESKAPNE